MIVHRRLTQLAASRNLYAAEVDQNIVVNTDRQSSQFQIDRKADLEEMGDWLRAAGVGTPAIALGTGRFGQATPMGAIRDRCRVPVQRR